MTITEILDLQDSIMKDPCLQPVGDTTYCNLAVQKYLKKLGYDKMDGLMANDMVDYMIMHFLEWQKLLDGTHAKERADLGDAVIAGKQYQEHGHVAMVRPGCPLGFSGHWNAPVPMLSNVGKKNGIMGANFAFPVDDLPPNYFRLVV